MTDATQNLSVYEQQLLNMEDVIEYRIRIDKKACAEVGRNWEALYDGECGSCGRTYESEFLVSSSPPNRGPQTELCIPCWRKENDLPKIDADLPETPDE